MSAAEPPNEARPTLRMGGVVIFAGPAAEPAQPAERTTHQAIPFAGQTFVIDYVFKKRSWARLRPAPPHARPLSWLHSCYYCGAAVS